MSLDVEPGREVVLDIDPFRGAPEDGKVTEHDLWWVPPKFYMEKDGKRYPLHSPSRL